MQKENQKFSDSELLEGMPSISALIDACEHPEWKNDRRILRVMIDIDKKRSKAREIAFLNRKACELGFCVEYRTAEDIEAMAVGTTHGGILAACTARTLPVLSSEAIRPDGIYYYLEGVEDPYTPNGIECPVQPGEDADIHSDHTVGETFRPTWFRLQEVEK